ncbi:3-demethylubiquinone-9 3-methyltransferase [Chryseobacterium angstadtii]|uniref:3-demethylubiquinone-9 3-methyltransferase n=1 Tax=Chryseobacterium angstadtii TaxID=558151 RepID=A0A0J7IE74_9FLAO|nr:VOC family protein [Chryseobacterium angstadtii]KMQ64743.1 3-demethylubiquinone-9 3-methyltransferase [Chryseobacterium angstadtii]
MNNTIFPCILYNGDARKSADFYCGIFNGKITVETPVVINIELFGQKIMLLNGPQQEKNASVSFMIICDTEDEIQKYWEQLKEGGGVLMELDSYPWSKKYGWVRDQYGVTWQLFLGEKASDQKLVPTLMFIHGNNGKAVEAMEFYTRIFPNSDIGNISRYKEGGETGENPENVMHAHFMVDDYSLFCMDSSSDYEFDFNEGISMVVMTDGQEETDYFWESLSSEGGSEEVCGWVKDKYGLSWQIFPKQSMQLINDSDQDKVQKVLQAIMKMKKIIIKDLEEAYNS